MMTKETLTFVEDYVEYMAGQRHQSRYSTLNTVQGPIKLARYDVNVVKNMAQSTITGTALTDRQAQLCLKLLNTYKRQFARLGIDVSPVLNEATYRMPVRNLDRTQKAWIENDVIFLKFPYSPQVVQQAREYAKDSCGSMTFDPAAKLWKLGLTELNVSWVVLWGTANHVDISQELADLYNLILDVDYTAYSIELTKVNDELTITNAPDSLIEYIETNHGGLNNSTLNTLVDMAGILCYTVDPALMQVIPETISKFGPKQNFRCDPTLENLKNVLQYAKDANRFPVLIFDPGSVTVRQGTKELLAELFDPSEVAQVDIAGDFKQGKLINCVDDVKRVKVVYAKKMPNRAMLEEIPRIALLVTYQEMIYGSNKQIWLGRSEKIAYMCETKLRNA